MSRRTERVGSTIQQELALIIQRELNDPRLSGMPSITRVKVSEDMSVADVYVTIMGSEAKQQTSLTALRHSAGLMRSRLTKSLSMRITPMLKFHIDENLKREIEVLDLLRKVEQENAELDRKRAAAAAGGAPVPPEDASGAADAEEDDAAEGSHPPGPDDAHQPPPVPRPEPPES